MKIVGYEFKDSSRFQSGADTDPNSVGKHLEELRKHFKGEITPKDVVDDARNPNSPLHSFFEWNDSAAAEHFRLSQARGLIRSVVAIYKEAKSEPRRIQAFVHVPEPGAPHYRDTMHALSQQGTREMVLRRAWSEFQAWRRRYKDLEEFADLFKKAEEVAKQLPFTDGH